MRANGDPAATASLSPSPLRWIRRRVKFVNVEPCNINPTSEVSLNKSKNIFLSVDYYRLDDVLDENFFIDYKKFLRRSICPMILLYSQVG